MQESDKDVIADTTSTTEITPPIAEGASNSGILPSGYIQLMQKRATSNKSYPLFIDAHKISAIETAMAHSGAIVYVAGQRYEVAESPQTVCNEIRRAIGPWVGDQS